VIGSALFPVVGSIVGVFLGGVLGGITGKKVSVRLLTKIEKKLQTIRKAKQDLENEKGQPENEEK